MSGSQNLPFTAAPASSEGLGFSGEVPAEPSVLQWKLMAIPNAKRYRIRNPNGTDYATVVAVLPKNADVKAYLKDAANRFDWKALQEAKAAQSKIRIGQQKQRRR